MRRRGFNPWVGKIPWRREWQPTPVLLPGKFHGQRSLVGYSPWGRKESDTTGQLYSLTGCLFCGSRVLTYLQSESHTVVSKCQNTEVGSLSLLQGIFPTQGSNPGLLHCRQILYQLSHKGGLRILEWVAYPFSTYLPDPGIEPESLALQTDSLPTELSGKPIFITSISVSFLCLNNVNKYLYNLNINNMCFVFF